MADKKATRKPPASSKVVNAKAVKGAARVCVKQQVGEQWRNFTDNELTRKSKREE